MSGISLRAHLHKSLELTTVFKQLCSPLLCNFSPIMAYYFFVFYLLLPPSSPPPPRSLSWRSFVLSINNAKFIQRTIERQTETDSRIACRKHLVVHMGKGGDEFFLGKSLAPGLSGFFLSSVLLSPAKARTQPGFLRRSEQTAAKHVEWQQLGINQQDAHASPKQQQRQRQ